jgi:hypothetical protein
MWNNQSLKDHLDTTSTVRAASAVHVEWNLNDPSNIDKVGNYRHRPTTTGISKVPIARYDPFDTMGEYTGATTADIVIEGELDDNNDPTIFTTPDEKMSSLFSLDDCFQPNRPRSGINKLLMLPGRRWIPANNYVDGRPRYYAASKSDPFKYWTSYRIISPEKEPFPERRYPTGVPATMAVGISKDSGNGVFYIEDACPFVVYKSPVYANRLTIKMQTHASLIEGTHVIQNGADIGDPSYGYENQQTPNNWTVQVLKNSVWTDVYNALPTTLKADGSPIIGPDGHVELAYGLRIPQNFNYIGQVATATHLPEAPMMYDAWLVAENQEAGFVHTYDGTWKISPAVYDWHLVESDYYAPLPLDDLAEMQTYNNGMETKYRDLDTFQGVRIVVRSMNTAESTFDLIEMSPRMVADVTNMVESYSIKSPASSMDATDLPVGYLLPGTGSITLLDNLSLFNDPNSIFNGLSELNTKFTFYEGADDVDGIVYHIPLKTLYSEAIPPSIDEPPLIKFELRDGFWMLEKMKAPSIFMENVSLSVAIATLLDYIGFSNYDFKREDKEEVIIPYFYTSDEKTVAEILQDLARTAQAAMFFDEYNNLVIMYKEYLMSSSRPTDIVFSGNSNTPHIVSIASAEKKRYNDGRLDYNERYIQRSVSSLQQASFLNEDQTLIYKPVLLWEASGTELTRASNEMGQTQSAFSLGACVLNTSLSNTPPKIVDGAVVNNVIDVGESVYWLPRYNGYFYANGEIIKFDAVEFAVSGRTNVWVSSNAEYQKYLADVPFNGKIFPTGRVRIYTEPEYAKDANGNTIMVGVRKHGRAQFQTPIASHPAGISSSWTDPVNRVLINQDSRYIFQTLSPPNPSYFAPTGKGKAYMSPNISVNGIVKNHFRNVQYGEGEVGTFQTARAGTLQSSALVLQGPKDPSNDDINNLSVVTKRLEAPFKHYGARMRIIGETKPVGEVQQDATGASTYYTDAAGIGNVVTGGSGGVVSHFDPATNTGYFFELVALSNTTIDSGLVDSNSEAHNLVFYKVIASAPSAANSPAIAGKMWGGRANIVVDTGEFIGQSRQTGEDFPSVYDIAIETKQIGSVTRFFLYLNGNQVGVVDDNQPLNPTNTYGLFVRGRSKAMFENTYALLDSTSSSTLIAESLPSAFGDSDVNTFEAMNKYAMSGIVQNTYLDRINLDTPPSAQMYYDEFGTIMRECAYFNIKFDKAFPALRARISPTFNKMQTYFVSGFTHHAYGAEFLVFNATDKALNLDETTGNYLRIQGVAFTQSNQRSLTMDDLFNEIGSTSDVFTAEMNLASDPLVAKETYRDIRIDRRKRGKNEFSLATEYIQRQDDARDMMRWLSYELTRPRLLVGIELFFYPIVQLGDIVEIDYTDSNGVDFAGDKRFVVYNIEYERGAEGMSQKVYLAEV